MPSSALFMCFATFQCSSLQKNAECSTLVDCTRTHFNSVNFTIEIHITYCPCVFDAEKKLNKKKRSACGVNRLLKVPYKEVHMSRFP